MPFPTLTLTSTTSSKHYTILLNAIPTILGRKTEAHAPTNYINISSKVISRSHLTVTNVNGEVMIQDTKSSGGTFLNGRRLCGSKSLSGVVRVHEGDYLQDCDFGGVFYVAEVFRVGVHGGVVEVVEEDVNERVREMVGVVWNALEEKTHMHEDPLILALLTQLNTYPNLTSTSRYIPEPTPESLKSLPGLRSLGSRSNTSLNQSPHSSTRPHFLHATPSQSSLTHLVPLTLSHQTSNQSISFLQVSLDKPKGLIGAMKTAPARNETPLDRSRTVMKQAKVVEKVDGGESCLGVSVDPPKTPIE